MENIAAVEYRTNNYIFEMKNIDNIKEHLNDYEYEIGHICDCDYNELLKIIYVKDAYEIVGGHCKLAEVDFGPLIVISKFFFDNYIINTNIKVLCAIFMHEFGHFMNGDLNSNRAEKSSELRHKYLMKNMVMPEELAADRFVVGEMTKSTMINAIEKMISVRKKRNDIGLNLAIKEFELRKKAISKL